MSNTRGGKSVIDMDLLGVGFLSLWCRVNETGLSLGVRWENHDVHYTIYSREDVLNCHITDKGKRIWEREVTLADMQMLAEKVMKKMIGRWRSRERVYPVNSRRLETWKDLTITDERFQRIDLGDYMKQTAQMLLEWDEKPVMLGNLMSQTPVFGLQKRRLGWYFILAMPDGAAARFPLNPSRSPLRVFPTFDGMLRYMNYIEKKGFFENIAVSPGNEGVQRILGEIELMASSLEIVGKEP